jgi:hypothetical protein
MEAKVLRNVGTKSQKTSLINCEIVFGAICCRCSAKQFIITTKTTFYGTSSFTALLIRGATGLCIESNELWCFFFKTSIDIVVHARTHTHTHTHTHIYILYECVCARALNLPKYLFHSGFITKLYVFLMVLIRFNGSFNRCFLPKYLANCANYEAFKWSVFSNILWLRFSYVENKVLLSIKLTSLSERR